MKELKLSNKIKKILVDFIERIKVSQGENLVSVILYGSAASGEFSDKHSNINILVVLNDSGLGEITKIASFFNKAKFTNINPLFFTRDFINQSLDVFPVEFLDIKENYFVLFGEDVPVNFNIDIKNLRYQCEHELRTKLINIRKLYLENLKSPKLLRSILVSSCNSVLHVTRNLLRIKNKPTPYAKDEIINQLSKEFGLDAEIFTKVLDIKKRNLKPGILITVGLFSGFINELEKIIKIVDSL